MRASSTVAALAAAGLAVAGPVNHERLHGRQHGPFHHKANTTTPCLSGSGASAFSQPEPSSHNPFDLPTPYSTITETPSAPLLDAYKGTTTSLVDRTETSTDTITSTVTVTGANAEITTTTSLSYEIVEYVVRYVTVVVTDYPGSPAPTAPAVSDNTPSFSNAAPAGLVEHQVVAPATSSEVQGTSDSQTAGADSNSDDSTEDREVYSSASAAQTSTVSVISSPLPVFGNSTTAGAVKPAGFVAVTTKTTSKSKTTSCTTTKSSLKTSAKTSAAKTTAKSTSKTSSTKTSSTAEAVGGTAPIGHAVSTKTTAKTTSSTKTTAKTSSTTSHKLTTTAPVKQVQTSSSKTTTKSTTKSTTLSTKVVTTSSKTTSKTTTTTTKSTTTTTTAKPTTTTSKTTTTVTPPAPTGTGTVAGCTQYYVAKSGDYCSLIAGNYGITTATFINWNPSVGSTCSTLYAGYAYCVAISASATTATSKVTTTTSTTVKTTTTTAKSVTAPAPTGTGTVSGCTEYYVAQSGDYCSLIAGNYGISTSTFISWNPSVGTNCNTLYAGYAYCVSISSSGSTQTTAAPTTTKATTTTATTATTVTPPATTGSGTVSGCTEYYVAQSGDYCSLIAGNYGISTSTFISWNPSVGSNCNTLYAGYAYCVSISANAATTTTTTASTSTSTAGPYDYVQYNGDGTTAQGWPSMDIWVDFDTLWSFNLPVISSSCSQFGVPENSANETAYMKTAIAQVAAEGSIDERFVLAIIMQESNGCVRVPTTSWSHANPGLMQDNQGNGTCNVGGVTPSVCSNAEILQMVRDGTLGTTITASDGSTSHGDGLVDCISEANTPNSVAQYYRAAHIYNGGLTEYNQNNLGAGCCTLCYASDVANRLKGWHSGASKCTLGTGSG